MKNCPYCAEEIKDEAIVCRYCGRSLTPGVGPTPTAVQPRKASRLLWMAAGGGLVVVLGALLALISAGEADQTIADSTAGSAERAAISLASPRPAPTVLDLVNEEAVDIAAEKYLHHSFTVERPANCRVEGRVRVLAGGNEDVEVYLLNEDDFLNWQRRAGSARAAEMGLFHSRRQTATTLNVPVLERGKYYLVISNAFSAVTSKKVQARARVVCRP